MTDETKHDFLLVITALIFIIFATGTGIPSQVPVSPTIVGPA